MNTIEGNLRLERNSYDKHNKKIVLTNRFFEDDKPFFPLAPFSDIQVKRKFFAKKYNKVAIETVTPGILGKFTNDEKAMLTQYYLNLPHTYRGDKYGEFANQELISSYVYSCEILKYGYDYCTLDLFDSVVYNSIIGDTIYKFKEKLSIYDVRGHEQLFFNAYNNEDNFLFYNIRRILKQNRRIENHVIAACLPNQF